MGYSFNEFPVEEERQEASSPRAQKAAGLGLSGAICGIFFPANDQIFMPN